jgi:hypothetical protein
MNGQNYCFCFTFGNYIENIMTKRTYILLIFLVLAIASRFIILAGPAWANFSPMGAMALFAGYYVKDKKLAILFSLLTLWISNLLLNNIFYATYFKGFSWGLSTSQFGLFAAITLLGAWYSSKKVNTRQLILINALSSVGFFIVSNLLVWAFSTEIVYTKDLVGLSACYVNALPFFPNTLYSQLIFGLLFFKGYEWAINRLKAIA